MRSCCPWVGRSSRMVLESPYLSEEKPYFNGVNKDPYTLNIREAETHLNMGLFDDADSKYLDCSAEKKLHYLDAVASHSPLAKEEESACAKEEKLACAGSGYAPVFQWNGYREEELNGVCTTWLTKKILCSKEQKKESIRSPSLEDDFIEIKKPKLSTKVDVSSPPLLEEPGVNRPTESLSDRFVGGKELAMKAIPDGGKLCDIDNHQNPAPACVKSFLFKEAEDCDKRYINMGVVTLQQKVKPAALFSYGISDQQRDFLFLCAGLVIQAVGFQLRSLVEIATALILLCVRAYIFACRISDTLSNAKLKLADMRALLFSYIAIDRERIAQPKEKWESVKPLIIQGAKKMGRGCLNAAYVLAILSALLLISFLFSYLAVKEGVTQKPIHITQELFFDYTQDHPVASLDLFSLDAYRRMSNATKGIKVNPGTNIWYDCILLLTLPESDHNRKLGVFQVRSEVLSEKGEIMVKGSQPCMLVFRSNILHHIRSLVMAIPVLTGLASEAQTLRLRLLQWHQLPHKTSNGTSTVRMLQIVLVPRAGLPTSTGLPHLYKARLFIDSLHIVGPRRSGLSIFPSSGPLRTLFMWIFLSFLIFCCLSSVCMYRMHHKSKPKEVGIKD